MRDCNTHLVSHKGLAADERSCAQAVRIALTDAGSYNNSPRQNFAHRFKPAKVVKHLAGSVKSFTHECDRLWFEV
jgi:hypothetical protein